MKKLLLISTVLVLNACSDDSGHNITTNENASFKATLINKDFKKDYDLKVSCISFDSQKFDTEFVFVSDRSGNNDINGDGLIIRGNKINLGKDKTPMPMNGFTIKITDNDTVYETNAISLTTTAQNKDTWQKNNMGVKGVSHLVKENDSPFNTYTLSYEVICK
jgi:hypothetical protein